MPTGANYLDYYKSPQRKSSIATLANGSVGSVRNRGASSNKTNSTISRASSRSGESTESLQRTLRENLRRREVTDTTTTESETYNETQDRMDARTRQAYNDTLALLQNGGSQQQRQAAAALAALQQRAQVAEGQYTVEAARAQAQQAQAHYARQLQEELLPGIRAATEGAGLSGDALAALLQQRQASNVATEASAAELDAIVQYGSLASDLRTLQAQVGQTLSNDPVMESLIALLEVGEGSHITTNGSRQRLTNERTVTDTTGSSTRHESATSRRSFSEESTETANSTGTTVDILSPLNADYLEAEIDSILRPRGSGGAPRVTNTNRSSRDAGPVRRGTGFGWEYQNPNGSRGAQRSPAARSSSNRPTDTDRRIAIAENIESTARQYPGAAIGGLGISDILSAISARY